MQLGSEVSCYNKSFTFQVLRNDIKECVNLMIAELKNLYNTHTTLWESFMNVYGKEIKDEVGMVWIHNEAGEKELNPYFCECSHLSQLGHDKWRDNTLPYIVKALENSH